MAARYAAAMAAGGRTTGVEHGQSPEQSRAERSDVVPQAEGAAAGDRLITRAEAARVAGRGTTTVRRWEQERKLTPVVGPDGTHLHSYKQVIELREHTTRRAQKPDEYDGPTAAKVFGHLAEGATVAELVTRFELHPRAAMAIARDYAEATETIFLTGSNVRELRSAFGFAPHLPHGARVTGVEFTKQMITFSCGGCQGCGDRPALYCGYGCATGRKQQRSQRR